NPIIGWMEDIHNYDVQTCRDFFNTWYVPGNCTVILTGDFNPEEAFRLVKHYYGPIPAKELPETRIWQELPQQGERRVVYHMPAQMPMLAVGYHAVAYNDPDLYSLTVLATILSDGESSRLYKRMVLDDQLVIWIGGMADQNFDPGLFAFWMTPLPSVAPEDAEAALYEELALLADEPVSEWELQKARNKLEDGFIFNLQDTAEKGTLIGRFHHLAGDWRLANDYLDNINAVTAADLQRCAAQYFTKNNRTVVTIMPETPAGNPQQPTTGSN
ncbi:MAG: insulinase family protein, partial [Pirellulales bacterium]|nr:insulinase family protein [Pirellulales bacterium]